MVAMQSFIKKCPFLLHIGRGMQGRYATPILQNLFYKIDQKISQKNFLFSVGYTNLKFGTSSLEVWKNEDK